MPEEHLEDGDGASTAGCIDQKVIEEFGFRVRPSEKLKVKIGW